MLRQSPNTFGLLILGLGLFACVRADPLAGPVDPALQTEAARTCEGAGLLAQVWTPERQQALRGALQRNPGEWPTHAFTSLDARVSEQRNTWAQAYADACAHGEPTTMRCLEHQAWELDALIAVIVQAPDHAAALWSAFDRAVADPRSCDQREGPSFATPTLDPSRGRELASLRLWLEVGDYAQVQALIGELESNPTIRDTPAYALRLALARAQVELAEGQLDAADQTIARASELAEQPVGPRETIAVANARAHLAAGRGDSQAVLIAGNQALSAARADGDAWLVFEQLRDLASLLLELDMPNQAIEPLTQAIALASRISQPENPHTAELQTMLAEAQLGLGQLEASLDSLTQARDTFVIALGPDHPQTLAAVEAIGRLFIAAGRPGDAQFAFLDLLEINSELYGPKDWRTAKIKLELGDALMAMDQYESAQTLYTEALTPLAQALGPEHRAVIRASIHLGIAELALGNLEAAQLHCAQGRDLAKALPPGGSLAAEAEQCLAQLTADAKR